MLVRQTTDAKEACVGSLLADPDTYGGSGANQTYRMKLGTAQISPGSIDNWVDATFDGSDPIVTEEGFSNGVDALTAQPTLTLNPPAGGWRWEVTGNGTLPETIRSVRIENVSNGNLPLATGLLEEPQTVNAVGQQLVLGSIQVIPIS